MSKIICPFCEMEINENDEKYACPDCETIYHKECWDVIDGCEKCKEINNLEFVKNRNIEVIASAPNNVVPIDQQLTNGNPAQVVMHNYNKPSMKNENKKIAIIGIMIAVVAIVIVLLVAKSSGTGNGMLSISTIDFSAKYSYMADEPYCTISSDGTWMSLDSSPNDFNGNLVSFIVNDYTVEVMDATTEINSDLGFSQAINEKMNHTTASQGKQTEENEKYKVTWSYDSYKGFSVLYEKK